MRILITNDDGIRSEVLPSFAKWAGQFGEVTVVAPKEEQSGKSHGIEIHKPFKAIKSNLIPGIEAYAVDSTPADCVRFGILGLHRTYDLVLSGINRGVNIGLDIAYSGTVGAVFEAACLSVPAVAVSTDPSDFTPALKQLDTVYDFFIRHHLLEKNNLYNVNIPLNSRGIRITRQGGPYYSDDFLWQENHLVKPTGKCVYEDSGNNELDTDAVMHGYISITPLTLNRTNMDVFHALSGCNTHTQINN